jgi:3-oxoacyl-[acyl-carrier protein] reductase
VINLSSSLAASPLQGAVVYSAAKAAVSALTRGFAKELGPRNITVNAVAPSVTATDMTADLSPEERAALTLATPLRRLGMPADIAGVVGFLASSAADWITGQTILVDGGLVDT